MTGPRVLAVNPGAGSTKLALYAGTERVREESLGSREPGAQSRARIWDELPLRVAAVRDFLSRAAVSPGTLAAVAARGGLLRPLPAGVYAVDEAMLKDLEEAARGQHAANLGAPIAEAIAAEHGCKALVVDPVSVDEMEPVARVTGLPGVERTALSHALNMRAVARRHAAVLKKPLSELGLVVAHLGTGISLSAWRGGRMVDVVNPLDEGPFAGDRAGGLPSTALVSLCFARGAEEGAVRRRLFGDGGFFAHLGTRDVREVLSRADAGDARAALLVEGMCYQTAKAVGGLAAALAGRVDWVLLTGGLSHLEPVVAKVSARLSWIAPVRAYPGEDECRALAEGALRVLSGEERTLCYAAEAGDPSPGTAG
ncbi:MAG TPA: butyrate kinase [Anaeromyxobacter sp.]|nr:butyrate kinase [Anaeromyxobacter sp.]